MFPSDMDFHPPTSQQPVSILGWGIAAAAGMALWTLLIWALRG